MSIPPLVCSTPPPPEQCEDDKDQEDFDLNYNSSQEDDEGNDYDYGNFSSFNHFQSTTPKNCQDIKDTQEENKDTKCNNTIIETSSALNNIKLDEDKSEVTLEDDVIEDLNLKIDHEPAGSIQKNSNEKLDSNINERTPKSIKGLEPDVPVDNVDNPVDQHSFELTNVDVELANVDNAEESITLNSSGKPQTPPAESIAEKLEDYKDCDENSVEETVFPNIVSQTASPQQGQLDENTVKETHENNDLDEFEDFDDFQYVSSDNKPPEVILDTESDNPWQNEDAKDEEFGQFTANFGEDPSLNQIQSSNQSGDYVQEEHDSEDDFGDFDEFQSVNDIKTNEKAPELCEDVPVLSLQSSDSEYQIIERINKVMETIFQEEISECDNVFESKLEASLGETWGYLRETDVRQPYIVNWNNSLAQKTLLKALCIDSRNILFGPKWSSSMPKYAATLSAAPLQPQKQTGQASASQSENVNPEKSMNKTWADPFTSDGQEFTYAEALLLDLEHLMATLDQMAHNHSTLKISELLSHACNTERENTVIETGPTDLDVFEAARSTKSDKIYSNTLSIQPMRQINLPDTHIFTPTNSEIPRSKTIHYDNTSAPTIILPQTVADNNISSQSLRPESDNDYWEFQDFKGTANNRPLESTVNEQIKDENKDATQKSNITLATQVLQPIKLEPIMPALNWPNPGEVKETFDDFSDFMSSSQTVNEKQESIQDINIPYPCKKDDENKDPHEKTSNIDNKVDDEFEMFQSALPSSKNIPRSELSVQNSLAIDHASSSHTVPIKMTDFDIAFQNNEKVKSENISLNSRPIENVLKNVDNTSNFKVQPLPSTALQMVNSNVLQPTLAAPGLPKQTQQKTGQILQPLSLESYSQINWPNPGIDLQDLSRFNPVETLQSFKSDSNSHSKTASPVHNHKGFASNNQTSDEDIWGEFVSSKPKHQAGPKKQAPFTDNEEWTDFVSSPSVNPQNGLNTISFNVHTNSNIQKSSNSSKYPLKSNEIALDIPSLNYITPKSNKSYNERHFQNL